MARAHQDYKGKGSSMFLYHQASPPDHIGGFHYPKEKYSSIQNKHCLIFPGLVFFIKFTSGIWYL